MDTSLGTKTRLARARGEKKAQLAFRVALLDQKVLLCCRLFERGANDDDDYARAGCDDEDCDEDEDSSRDRDEDEDDVRPSRISALTMDEEDVAECDAGSPPASPPKSAAGPKIVNETARVSAFFFFLSPTRERKRRRFFLLVWGQPSLRGCHVIPGWRSGAWSCWS